MLFGRLADNATPVQASSDSTRSRRSSLRSAPHHPDAVAPIVADRVRGIANVGNRRRAQVVATFLTVVVAPGASHRLRERRQSVVGARRRQAARVRAAARIGGEPASRAAATADREPVTGDRWRRLRSGACALDQCCNRALAAAGTGPVSNAAEFDLDWRVLTFTALVSLATTVLCGLLPAWRALSYRTASSPSRARSSSVHLAGVHSDSSRRS